MASLVAYGIVQVVTPDPSEAGGLAINNNFKAIVDSLNLKAASSHTFITTVKLACC